MPTAGLASDQGQPLVEVQRVARVLNDQGRLVELAVIEPASGQQQLRLTQAYNSSGRMTQRTMAHQGKPVSSIESWQFDTAGRELLRTVSYPGEKPAANNWFERHAYNSAGRVVLHEQGTDLASKPTWRQVSVYACP